MKTIGVVGGIGPESTVDYSRLILASSRKRGIERGQAALINSIDVTRLAVSPANVHAAQAGVTLRGSRATAIWLRVPMQLLLAVITWWSAVTSAP